MSQIPEGVLIALITGIMAIIGNIIVSHQSAKELYSRLDKQSEINDQKLDAKLEKYQAVTDQKVEELTREVRKHNNFAEEIPVIKERISTVSHRVDDLERRNPA